MGFGQAVKSGFNNYATFSGRARRSEFWWWMLFQTLVLLPFTLIFIATYVVFIVSLVEATDQNGDVVGSQVSWAPMAVAAALMLVASLALALPSYAVWARRLHDMGQPGWWLLLNFVSLGIVPFIMAFFDSQVGPNQWGADLKADERGQYPAGYQAQVGVAQQYPAQGYAAPPTQQAPPAYDPQAAPPVAQAPAPTAPPAPPAPPAPGA
ncbi:DUF805 domain-containing protein [Demequina aurantiaca]|uniref:DUF805 domain-containing protein n=1 Tax=Demequina aurantiaca TaxID=676200 RepID=UPI003D32A603